MGAEVVLFAWSGLPLPIRRWPRAGPQWDHLDEPTDPTTERLFNLVAGRLARQLTDWAANAAGFRHTCNGNPLHPDPEGATQAQDIHMWGGRDDVRSAGLGAILDSPRLERRTVAQRLLRLRDYQWNEVAIPFWKVQGFAADHDVNVCLEMHPQAT